MNVAELSICSILSDLGTTAFQMFQNKCLLCLHSAPGLFQLPSVRTVAKSFSTRRKALESKDKQRKTIKILGISNVKKQWQTKKSKLKNRKAVNNNEKQWQMMKILETCTVKSNEQQWKTNTNTEKQKTKSTKIYFLKMIILGICTLKSNENLEKQKNIKHGEKKEKQR